LLDTIVEIANKVEVVDIVGRTIEIINNKKESYHQMVMETIEKVVSNLGSSYIGAHMEKFLIDGTLYVFREQKNDDAYVSSQEQLDVTKFHMHA
jgi:splicing factor 3B subunit 1